MLPVLKPLCKAVKGNASYGFVVAEPPVAGNCSILPTEGYGDRTMFNITCTNFDDEDLPLHYMFYLDTSKNDVLHPHGKISKHDLVTYPGHAKELGSTPSW